MNDSLIWDSKLIARYNRPGPRYTSYPTAVQFNDRFKEDTYCAATCESGLKQTPLSLYFHIPFCDTVCFYCGCNKIVTKHRYRAEPYLELMFKEMAMHAKLLGYKAPVEQLHLGGGTPTFLNQDQLRRLIQEVEKHFTLTFSPTADYSIEIDPREADWSMMGCLRDLGFNRISLGVQDFDLRVQQAVNRIQPRAMTESIIDACRVMNFNSVNIDLIYGLPLQTIDSFLKTVDQVIEMAPERLSVFNYAHLPHRFMPQRRIREEDLPSAETKLKIIELTTQRLIDAGYVYIGMDHFALPDDDLAIAQVSGKLHRNFQGYTTHGHCDLIAMGVSSISQVGHTMSQNYTDMENYQKAINEGHLPIYRGLETTAEDRLRAYAIRQLICNFKLDFHTLEEKWGVNFSSHFAEEFTQFQTMADDGLLTIDSNGIHVLPRGRLLIRNICMVFDAYLAIPQDKPRFSNAI